MEELRGSHRFPHHPFGQPMSLGTRGSLSGGRGGGVTRAEGARVLGGCRQLLRIELPP